MSIKDINKEMQMGFNESLGNSSRVRVLSSIEETPTRVVTNNTNNNVNIFRGTFKECLKNHAVNKGGHALDGCCEFLPAGPEGSIDAFKCAACHCHRNFHRKEAPLPPTTVAVSAPVSTTVIPAGDAYPPTTVAVAAPVPTTIIPVGEAYPPYNAHRQQAATPPQYTVYHVPKGLLHVTATPPNGVGGPSGVALISPGRGVIGGADQNNTTDHDNGGIGSSSNSMKRFRTKFTPELKEKMKAFAERLDWRIQKQDDAVVQEFCNENGVKRQVLKVWMHNNKHTIDQDLLVPEVMVMCAMKFEVEEFGG